MVRWNVDAKNGPETEMPCENFDAGTMGPIAHLYKGLEDEPDLYEDMIQDD